MIIKRCNVCGNKFEAEYDGKFMFCSDECTKEGKRIFRTITKECKNCGREFEIDRKNTNFCCDECKEEARRFRSRENYEPAKPVAKVCEICGKEFEGHGNSKYCCDECRAKGYKKNREEYEKSEKGKATRKKRYKPAKPVTKVCKICGKEFETNRKNTVCCSDECKKEYQKKLQKQWRDSQEKIKCILDEEIDDGVFISRPSVVKIVGGD